MNAVVRVQVVCAWPHRVWSRHLALPAGSTIADALAASKCRADLGADLGEPFKVGLYGRIVPSDLALTDGDRIELYRPLLADPKQARRLRAAGHP